jgi:hypothetical protein
MEEVMAQNEGIRIDTSDIFGANKTTLAERQWAKAAAERDVLRTVVTKAREALEACALIAEAIDRCDDAAVPQMYRGKCVTDIYEVAREALSVCDAAIHAPAKARTA